MSQAASAPNAVMLLDDSIALLRRAPSRAWLAWTAGTLPFGLAVIAFVTELTSNADAREALAGHALGLAILYLWMVCCQAAFGRALWPLLTGEALPRHARLFAAARTQAMLWSAALLLIPVGALSVAGLPWTISFFYGAAAFPTTDREPSLGDVIRYASARAGAWTFSTVFGLAIASMVWAVVFINAAVLLIGMPLFLRTLTGQENVFTRDPAGMLNSTLIAAALVIACLAVDPLLRAMFVIRCFRLDAIHTGIDLKAVVARHAKSAAAVALVLWLVSGAAMANNPAARLSIDAPSLDRTIREVTKRPEYVWREPRTADAKPPSNAFLSFTEEAAQFVARQGARVAHWIGKGVRAVVRWLLGNNNEPLPDSGSAGPSARFATSALYVLIVIAAGGAVALLLRIRFRSRRRPLSTQAAPVVRPVDLASDDVSPDQAPEDEWLALAAQFVNAGDLRLATRALYLATLAGLGRVGLLTLHRSRSNQDYRRELARRARSDATLQQAFAGVIGAFERTWYGLHPISPDAFDNLRASVLAMRNNAAAN